MVDVMARDPRSSWPDELAAKVVACKLLGHLNAEFSTTARDDEHWVWCTDCNYAARKKHEIDDYGDALWLDFKPKIRGYPKWAPHKTRA